MKKLTELSPDQIMKLSLAEAECYPELGLGWRVTMRMYGLMREDWETRHPDGPSWSRRPNVECCYLTIGDFVELCERRQYAYTDLIGGSLSSGKTIAGKGTVAQIIALMKRIGHPFPWMDAVPQWVEGRSILGHTGMSTRAMPECRVDQLATIRANIQDLEDELARQRETYQDLVARLKRELEDERAAFDAAIGSTDREML